MLTKRQFLTTLSAAAVAAGTGALLVGRPTFAVEGVFEITKTNEEWRAILDNEQYDVLRRHATEYPGSSPLLYEHRAGLFHCAGCDLPVYSSEHKYESGTGWPSFWQSLDNAIGTTEDRALYLVRTEIHCRRCGGHFGHLFTDGPPPTGLRHCLNGVALTFHPSPAA